MTCPVVSYERPAACHTLVCVCASVARPSPDDKGGEMKHEKVRVLNMNTLQYLHITSSCLMLHEGLRYCIEGLYLPVLPW